jgi:hypothetical protein
VLPLVFDIAHQLRTAKPKFEAYAGRAKATV